MGPFATVTVIVGHNHLKERDGTHAIDGERIPPDAEAGLKHREIPVLGPSGYSSTMGHPQVCLPFGTIRGQDGRRVAQMRHRTLVKRHKTMENLESKVRLKASLPSA